MTVTFVVQRRVIENKKEGKRMCRRSFSLNSVTPAAAPIASLQVS